MLAREAGMSVSTFHANFKAVTAKPPLRYLQTIRLHKAQVLMVAWRVRRRGGLADWLRKSLAIQP